MASAVPAAPGSPAAPPEPPAAPGRPGSEAAGAVAAAVTWLLGEPLLWLGGRAAGLRSWHRPVPSLLGFLGANLLFWLLALTPWRVYHLISMLALARVVMQILKDLVLSRARGAQLWRSLSESWEVVNSKEDGRPGLSHCIAESWMNFSMFLQEMSLFKQQSPGKFCLLVCSVCTFFTILGSYVPGVILSYLLLLFAFLCPLFKCNDIGQKVCSKIKSALLKLDFGIGDYINQKKRERSDLDRPGEEDLADFPALEHSPGAQEEDEIGFGLSQGLRCRKARWDRCPPGGERPAGAAPASDPDVQLMRSLAGNVLTAAVKAALQEQLEGAPQALAQALPGAGEDSDPEEADDFELLDQSELEQLDGELGLSSDPEPGNQPGFFSQLLGGGH